MVKAATVFGSRSFASMIASLSLAACMEAPNDPARYQDVLADLEGGQALYGHLYVGPPPEGRRLLISVHERDTVDPCALYGPDGEERRDDTFWYLGLELGSTAAGEYSIVTDLQERNEASGRLVHVRAFERTARLAATSGSVVVEGDAGVESTERVHVDIGLPSRQPVDFECNSDHSREGPTTTVCTCRYDDGDESSCTSVDGSDCCDRGGERLEFKVDLQAEFCPFMCAFTSPELAGFCYETRP